MTFISISDPTDLGPIRFTFIPGTPGTGRINLVTPTVPLDIGSYTLNTSSGNPGIAIWSITARLDPPGAPTALNYSGTMTGRILI